MPCRFNGSCIEAACAAALAPSTLGNVDSMEMGVLPAEAYAVGCEVHYTSQPLSCKIRHLTPGQYTLLIHVDEGVTGTTWNLTRTKRATFRYSFLCPKIEIRTDAMTSGEDADEATQRRIVRPEDVEVMDAATFLERTAPWVDRSALDIHMQHLRESAEEHLRQTLGQITPEPIPEDILSAMEPGEACDHLGRFLDHIPKQNNPSGEYDGLPIRFLPL